MPVSGYPWMTFLCISKVYAKYGNPQNSFTICNLPESGTIIHYKICNLPIWLYRFLEDQSFNNKILTLKRSLIVTIVLWVYQPEIIILNYVDYLVAQD